MEIKFMIYMAVAILSLVASFIAEKDFSKGFFGTLALTTAFMAGLNSSTFLEIKSHELSPPEIKIEILNGDTISCDTIYIYKPIKK